MSLAITDCPDGCGSQTYTWEDESPDPCPACQWETGEAELDLTEKRSRAWYGLWPLDALAIGPYRFREPVTCREAIAHMTEHIGEPPREAWPA